MKPNVAFSVSGDVATLTLTGPKKNALSREMHHALAERLAELREQPEIRFVVIRGADGVFSSGGDVTQLSQGLPGDYVEDYRVRMDGTIGAMRSIDQVVIAAVEGVAIGAAAALAFSADLVLAESDAKIRLSFVHLGFVPDAGATYMLPQALGAARARDLLMTGRWITVEEACAGGLISRSCPPGALEESVDDLLAELRLAPPHALAMTKHLINDREQEAHMSAVIEEGRLQPAAAALTSPELIAEVLERARRRRRAAAEV